MLKRISKYSFVLSLLWLGFVISISFMEAPVKFTAPSLSLAAGLDVGMRVFFVLNKVELLFALLIALSILFTEDKRKLIFPFVVSAGILLVQTIWLLPALNERALVYISGSVPAHSIIHIIYVVIESIKVIFILFLSVMLVKNYNKSIITGYLKSSI